MLPLTWFAQVASYMVMLALGITSLAVAAHRGPPERHRAGWRMAAQLFTLGAVSGLVQNAWGAAALLAGPGTPTWDTYLRWSPGFNYGRCLEFFAFGGLLIAHSLRPADAGPLRSRTVWVVLLAAYSAGTPLGLWEGPMGATHYANYALLNTGLVVILLCAFLVAVATDAVDRLLALSLTAKCAGYPLVSLWLNWQSQEAPGVRVPYTLYLVLNFVLFGMVALAIALHRLRLARRGVAVPGFVPTAFRRAGVA